MSVPSGEDLLRRFRERYGRDPRPGLEIDREAMWALLSDEERRAMIERVFVEECEAQLLDMVAQGRAEFHGVSEDGGTLFTMGDEPA